MSSLQMLAKQCIKSRNTMVLSDRIIRRWIGCRNYWIFPRPRSLVPTGSFHRRFSSTSRGINYFKLLNLPQRFDLDEESLRSQFQQGMMEYHPDKHATKSEAEQKEAEEISMELNTAKTVLESPLSRAQHLLSLIDSDDGTSNTLDDGYQIMDQSFLFDIMDIRSDIESTKDADALQQLLDANAVIMEGLTNQIATAFRCDDDGKGDVSVPQENVENIRELLAKLTYYNKIEGEIKDKMPSRD